MERLADQILEIIRDRRGVRFRLDDIAGEVGAKPQELPGAIRLLRAWGYDLDLTETGVRLLATPDSLTATELSYMLGTEFVGNTIMAYRDVKSTNDIAAREAEKGAEEGTVIVAEEQTQGRGRQGRSWHSPFGSGAYVSIILRPDLKPDLAPGLSLVAGLSLAEVLEQYCPKQVGIKWPNDVLLRGRKTAGILTELSAERGKINHVVVGVGININQTSLDFPDELLDIATSVRNVHGTMVDRVELVKRFLRSFEQEYKSYCESLLEPSRSRIRKYSSLLGRNVRVETGKKAYEGKAVDINEQGLLVVEIDGKRREFSSGEVTQVTQ
jgi:BirA family biotin operon repressor/biotin-[acetyl-CoA-carboxylase] ligase